ARIRQSTFADTRRRATSTRQWNWRSITKPIASAWRSTPSTAFPGCSASADTPRRSSATGSSPAALTHTNLASTCPKFPDGDGLRSQLNGLRGAWSVVAQYAGVGTISAPTYRQDEGGAGGALGHGRHLDRFREVPLDFLARHFGE